MQTQEELQMQEKLCQLNRENSQLCNEVDRLRDELSKAHCERRNFADFLLFQLDNYDDAAQYDKALELTSMSYIVLFKIENNMELQQDELRYIADNLPLKM